MRRPTARPTSLRSAALLGIGLCLCAAVPPPAYTAIDRHYTEAFGRPLEGTEGLPDNYTLPYGGASSAGRTSSATGSLGGDVSTPSAAAGSSVATPPSSWRVPRAGPRPPVPTQHTGTCDSKTTCSCCVAMQGCGWCRPGLFAEVGSEPQCMYGTAAGPGQAYPDGCPGSWDFSGTWSCTADASAAECNGVAEPPLLPLEPEVRKVQQRTRELQRTLSEGRSDHRDRMAWWQRAASVAHMPLSQQMVDDGAAQSGSPGSGGGGGDGGGLLHAVTAASLQNQRMESALAQYLLQGKAPGATPALGTGDGRFGVGGSQG